MMGLFVPSMVISCFAFFNCSLNIGTSLSGTQEGNDVSKTLKNQSDLIDEYRRISRLPEIGNAIDEIVNEAVFEPNSNDVLFLDFGEGISEGLQKSVIEQFDKVLKLLNMSHNADMLFRRWYIDGRLALNLVYDNADLKKGIQRINLMSPYGLYFDNKQEKWCYSELNDMDGFGLSNFTDTETTKQEYKKEEIAYSDSGIYEKKVILSHLHPVIKVSNQLQTLEDLLIPLRFSRSISRRVFNIDVGDLSYAKGLQAVKKIRDNFKYKKYYDVANGRISNSSTIASIVEDYFLPKRGDSKGSSIDVLEETGNLGETGDIEYFQKKLAQSLKVPTNRLVNGTDGGGTFDFTGTQIENEEKKFFAFIHRLRNRFNLLVLDILKYQLISTNTMNLYEWRHYQSKIYIKWVKTSNYLQRQHIELFKGKMDLYTQVSDHIGKLYSSKWVLTNILGFSDQEILEMKESLTEEDEENLNDEVNKAADKNIDNIFDEEEPEEFESKEPEESEGNEEESEEPNPKSPSEGPEEKPEETKGFKI
jgi:hypothetical protein